MRKPLDVLFFLPSSFYPSLLPTFTPSNFPSVSSSLPSFHKYLLSIYYVPDNLLGAWALSVNKTEVDLCLEELVFYRSTVTNPACTYNYPTAFFVPHAEV